MTQPQASGPAQPPPFAAMLRGAVIPTVCTAPVIMLVFWVTRQTRGGLAALLGVSIAVVFFAGGLYVMSRVVNASPLSVLSGAVALYFGQMIVLGLVAVGLSGARWLDSIAFGISVLVAVIAWQVFLIVAVVRARRPVYDTPRSDASEVAVTE